MVLPGPVGIDLTTDHGLECAFRADGRVQMHDEEGQDGHSRDGMEEMRKLQQLPALPEVRKIQQQSADTQHHPGEHRDPVPELLAGIELFGAGVTPAEIPTRLHQPIQVDLPVEQAVT